MTDTPHTFLMCPPLEIVGKKQLVLASRGYFEISRNKIRYKVAGLETTFILLNSQKGIAKISPFSSIVNYSTMEILSDLFIGLTEFYLYSQEKYPDILMTFLYENLIPFMRNDFEPGFYELREFPDSIFEEYYRESVSLEVALTTTIKTFDENVFIPFKQRFVSSIHNRNRDQNLNEILGSFSRDFPKFFSLHQDLLTVLYGQAKEVSERQQIAFNSLYPILRRFRLLKTLNEYLEIKKRRKGIETKINPKKVKTEEIAKKLEEIMHKVWE